MRRKEKQCSTEEAFVILDNAEFGVLSMADNGVPYGVPVNFVRDGDVLIFHCALQGRKLDCLCRSPQVAFCVAEQHGLEHCERFVFSTVYSSVIVFGTAAVVEEVSRKVSDLIKLTAKYFPESVEDAAAAAERLCAATCVVEITIDSITGKKGR